MWKLKLPFLTERETQLGTIIICDALCALEKHNIVHGGICPDNIMLTKDSSNLNRIALKGL